MSTKVRCIVSEKANFIVFLLPKNASSTIRAELKKREYDGFEEQYHLLDQKYKSYKKAVFLREPVDRFLSGYHEVYCRHIGEAQYLKSNGIERRQTHHFLDLEDSLETVSKFLDHIESRGFFDVHIQRQMNFIRDISIDFYFSTHSLQRDMEKLYQLIGSTTPPAELPHFRRRRVLRDRRNYIYRVSELPEELVQRIRQIYQEDITLYNEQIMKIK